MDKMAVKQTCCPSLNIHIIFAGKSMEITDLCILATVYVHIYMPRSIHQCVFI